MKEKIIHKWVDYRREIKKELLKTLNKLADDNKDNELYHSCLRDIINDIENTARSLILKHGVNEVKS